MGPRVRTAAHAGAVVLLYAVLYAAFFSPVLFTGRLLAPGDASFVSLPHFFTPPALWSPLVFSGFPVMGDPQTLAWYPPARLFAWLGSFNGFVLSAYVLASAFTYGYVYRLTGSRVAAVVGGTVYGMSGFFMAHLGHTNIIHSAAWMPLLVWSLEELCRRVSLPAWLGAVLAVSHGILAGQPQFAVYALALGGAYALYRARGASAGPFRFGAVALSAVLVGIATTGVLLLPMFQLQAQSVRAGMTFAEFAGYNLPIRQLPQLLFPYSLGGFRNPLTGGAVPDFTRGGGLTEATGFVGLLPLVLAAWGVCARPREPVVRFWLGVAAVTLVLALGKETPLCALVFRVPLYNKFRILTRHLVEFALAAGILAGFGVASLARAATPERVRWTRRGVVGLLLLLSAGLAMHGVLFSAGRYGKHLDPGLVPLCPPFWKNPGVGLQLAVLPLVLGTLAWWARRPRGLANLALLLGLVVDLACFGWFYEWNSDATTPDQFREPAALRRYREDLAPTAQRLVPLDAFGPSESAPPDRSRLWRVPSALGHSPLALGRYCEFLGVRSGGFAEYQALAPESRALDLLAVRYVLAPRSLSVADAGWTRHDLRAALADPTRFRHVEDLEQTSIFENRSALPRAWIVPAVARLSSGEVVNAVHEGRLPDGSVFDPRRLGLVEEEVPLGVAGGDVTAAVDSVRVGDDAVDVRTRSTVAALLVLSDVDYPGWEATVNGRVTPIVRTDYVLRGVPVPPGEAVVSFRFRPRWFVAGAAVTACSLLLIAALLLGKLRAALRAPARGHDRWVGAAGRSHPFLEPV